MPINIELVPPKESFEVATNRWKNELSMKLSIWLQENLNDMASAVAAQFEAAQQEDPEFGLTTYRAPNMHQKIMQQKAVKEGGMPSWSRNLASPEKAVFRMFNVAELDAATSKRIDIEIMPKYKKSTDKPLKIRGWGDKAYPYWAVLEYGSRTSRRHFVRTVALQGGGLGAYMQKRVPGSGAGQVSAKALRFGKGARRRVTMPNGSIYYKAWPPKPGYRIISHARDRLQWKLNSYVSSLLNTPFLELPGWNELGGY